MRQFVSLFTAQGLISSSIICKICSQISPLGVFVHSTHNFWAGLLMVYISDENFCFFKLTPKEDFYPHSGAAIALVRSYQVLANQLFVDKMMGIDKCFCSGWQRKGRLLWHRPQFSTTPVLRNAHFLFGMYRSKTVTVELDCHMTAHLALPA